MRTEELRKHRRLLGGLIERVLELEVRSNRRVFTDRAEAAQEPEEAAPNVSAPSEGAEGQNGSQRPWWRRLFG